MDSPHETTPTSDCETLGAPLIVLLGYRNHPDGELFKTTKARCAVAASEANADQTALVVPTGNFGKFNESLKPHRDHLSADLVKRGIDPKRIRYAGKSARTLEDALVVRRFAIDHSSSQITVVTSEFHMARAKFLFERILPEFELKFVESDDCRSEIVSDEEAKEVRIDIEGSTFLPDRPSERKKLAKEKSTWIDFPLYGSPPIGKQFPQFVYENAHSEQRIYDNISYLLMVASFAAFAFAVSRIGPAREFLDLVWLLLTIPLLSVFFGLYSRCSDWAAIGRKVLYLIESQWQTHGVSYNFLHGRAHGTHGPLASWVHGKRFYQVLRMLVIAMQGILAIFLVALLADSSAAVTEGTNSSIEINLSHQKTS